MFRVSLRWACAKPPVAAAAAAASGASQTSPKPKGDEKRPPTAPQVGGAPTDKKGRPSKPIVAFKPLAIHAWQRASLNVPLARKNPTIPEPLQFHGSAIGPRPLIVLGGSVTAETAGASASKFSAMLSQLEWPHGAIHIPIKNSGSLQLLQDSCDEIVNVLDALGVGWTHFLTHSVGSLVAAKMTFRYPTRIGTMILLDTPIVEKQWIANAATREEIRKARDDVNVPVNMLDFSIQNLKQNLEPQLKHTDAADEEIYSKNLFDSHHLFGSSGGVTRCDHRYLTPLELQSIKHPVQIVTPSAGALCDNNVHKDFFNLRRLQPIKSASNHEALFGSSNGTAEEIGGLLEQWLQRFEPDVVLGKRYEGAAKDMRTRMGPGPGEAAASGTAKPEAPKVHPPGKKKEQKKGK